MIASFLLSQTLVPVLANWMMKGHANNKEDKLVKTKARLMAAIQKSSAKSKWLIPVVILLFLIIAYAGFKGAGTEIFPKVDAGQMQVRLRLPTGTRIEIL